MSAVSELTEKTSREVWLISRYEPRKRQRIILTPEDEEKILSSSEYEIVDGEVYERDMPNPKHGRIQAYIATEMNLFLRSHRLGAVYTETHFRLSEGITRVPDVAFVSFERFPGGKESEGSRWLIPPDLAIEINSPTDDHVEILRKISDYFAAEVKQVWLVEPEFKIITIYHSFFQTTIYNENEELLCESILSGFKLNLKEVFELSVP